MQFAIAIPQFVADGQFDGAGFRAYMRRAEELGFASAWTQEGLFTGLPQLGALETMTYAAACTERMRLGCAVFVTTLHSPIHLAKSLSSLDQLSRGRLDIGVGLGRPDLLPVFGIDPSTRVARFTEGLRLLDALWTQPRVTFEGRFWHLKDVPMEPKPFQKPRPPIWFGASHPDALRRAVRYGDAFMGGGSTPTPQFAEQVKVVRGLLAEAGRDPATFPIAKRVYVAVDEDRERTGARIDEAFAGIYGRSGLAGLAVYGPPDECARAVSEAVDAGAETILFTTVFEPAEQMERIAAEVMPRV